jgi:hypothetical protein
MTVMWDQVRRFGEFFAANEHTYYPHEKAAVVVRSYTAPRYPVQMYGDVDAYDGWWKDGIVTLPSDPKPTPIVELSEEDENLLWEAIDGAEYDTVPTHCKFCKTDLSVNRGGEYIGVCVDCEDRTYQCDECLPLPCLSKTYWN